MKEEIKVKTLSKKCKIRLVQENEDTSLLKYYYDIFLKLVKKDI
jgi:predicted GIY-YIG superfamily endonuclease